MKWIIGTLVTLLHIVCNADSVRRSCIVAKTDYVTIASSEQSRNTISSDNSTKFDRRSNNSMRTVYVPSPVSFSTQHRHFPSSLLATSGLRRHHSSAPQYNLNHMSIEQLVWYFSANNYTEGEVLSHPMLYMNQAYLALAKQLPRYPEFVERYYKRYRHHKGLYAAWEIINFRYRNGMREKLAELYQECEDQRSKERACKRRERDERAKKEAAIVVYCAQLESLPYDELTLDAVPHQHQQARAKACVHTKASTPDRIMRQYSVMRDTVAFAHEYAIAEHDITSLQGNAYEQQLHIEFLEQLSEARTISTSYALQPKNILIGAVGHGAAIGMEANRTQQPETATAWADFGWKVVEIIKGVGDGLLLCAESTAHCIQDPKHTVTEFVHALGTITGYCARAIGTVAHWHELIEQGNALLMTHEIDEVANKISVCGTLCADKLSTMSARDIAKNSTHIVVDMVITHKMLTLGSQLCSQLKPIVADLITNIRKEEAFVEFALQGAEEFGSTAKISFLMEEVEANATKNILSSAKAATGELTIEHALAKWNASEKLKQLEQQCTRIANKIADTRLGSHENKFDLLAAEYVKIEKIAVQKYEKIRNAVDDITTVAKNTGIDIEIIKQIKGHVFMKKHILHDGIGRFAPDLDMADAWERLISNTFLKSDLEFLKHEYAESILMGTCEVPWRNAHDLTNTVYNWMKYLKG